MGLAVKGALRRLTEELGDAEHAVMSHIDEAGQECNGLVMVQCYHSVRLLLSVCSQCICYLEMWFPCLLRCNTSNPRCDL